MDILFIHVPKTHDYHNFFGDITFINLISNGLVAMADFLEKKGFSTKILHLGVNYYMWGDFDPTFYIEKLSPKLIAISLHWHYQSYDVIQISKKIKEKFPHIPIILGGLTASYFAEEIISQYLCIDGVIKGDGEIPLYKLINLLRGKDSCKPFTWEKFNINQILEIPNLCFRWKGSVKNSPLKYTIEEEVITQIDYSRFDLILNYEKYIKIATIPPIFIKKKWVIQNKKVLDPFEGVFVPTVGRGCPYRCAWCGKEERKKIIIRPVSVVAEEIKKAKSFGAKTIYFTFEPYPHIYSYYQELFAHLKNMNVNCYFECWSLPPKHFLDEFKKAFPKGIIAISPDTGSELLRKKHKGPSYSNAQLMETLEEMEKRKIHFDLFFAIAIPEETYSTFLKTEELMKKISLYSFLDEMCLFSIEIEPASMWQKNPAKYNVVSKRNTFLDYIKAHGPQGKGSFNTLGYYIPNYFPKENVKSVEEFEQKINLIKRETSKKIPKLIY